MPAIWQQKMLSILFLPPCILSIIGSSFIIKNIREEGKQTPYRSIMLWTSICDIIASAGIFLQPFLPPANRPDTYVWAFGNDASCNALGCKCSPSSLCVVQDQISLCFIFNSCHSVCFQCTHVRRTIELLLLDDCEAWSQTT